MNCEEFLCDLLAESKRSKPKVIKYLIKLIFFTLFIKVEAGVKAVFK